MSRFHPLLTGWPAASEDRIRLRVTAATEGALRRGHPWVFSDRIRDQGREGAAGDLAVVFDRKRAFLAVGLYDPHSPIRLRVLRARTPGPIDATFFAETVGAALDRRAALRASAASAHGTDGYRMIHGESDGLPGCVVDRYGSTGVVKLYTLAWLPHLVALLEALLARQPLDRLVLRFARLLIDAPELLGGLRDGMTICGEAPDGPLVYRENGMRLHVDPVNGQKTGTFLDQRDNRERVRLLAGGRRVLNVFSYHGGFSVAAARGGAREVCSLDLSAPALRDAERNIALNADDPRVAAARHETLRGDAFDLLGQLASEGRRFDLVILDPPAFARRKRQVPRALEAYARLARLGLDVLEPGGTIVLASCSSPVSAADFRAAVEAAARRIGRPLCGVEETGHAPDHPCDFDESRYLKALFATA